MSEGDVSVYHRLSSTRQLLRIDTSWSYFLQAFGMEATLVCVYGPIRALATDELHGHDPFVILLDFCLSTLALF